MTATRPIRRDTVLPVRTTTGAILRLDRSDSGTRAAPNGEAYDHRFIASTELLASDGGVIPLKAWNLEKYLQRPRWITMHNLGGFGEGKLTEMSLGRCVDIRIEEGLDVAQVGPTGRALVAYVRYSSVPFAQQVKTMYEEGALDDVSVRWDWRTEKIRQPYEEEAKSYGDDLYWVAEYVELVELSAVLIGADSGAQKLRAAILQCRTAGHEVPLIERFLDNMERNDKAMADLVTEPRATEDSEAKIDSTALSDAFNGVDAALRSMDAWFDQLSPIRQSLNDNLTAMRNLIMASNPTMPKKDEDEERGRVDLPEVKVVLSSKELAEALKPVNETLTAFGKKLEEIEQKVSSTQPTPPAQPTVDTPAAVDKPTESATKTEPVTKVEELVVEKPVEKVQEPVQPVVDEPFLDMDAVIASEKL